MNRIKIQDKPRFQSGFLIKFLPCSVSLGIIGCLTLSLKKEGILVHQQRNQLVESVARSNCNCLKGPDICSSSGNSWQKIRNLPYVRA